MPDPLDDFFDCKKSTKGWTFYVGVVVWEAQIPHLHWRPFRQWKTEPDTKRIHKAREAALKLRRFFRTCDRCGKLTNAGHMHDTHTCQSCAERFWGVLY